MQSLWGQRGWMGRLLRPERGFWKGGKIWTFSIQRKNTRRHSETSLWAQAHAQDCILSANTNTNINTNTNTTPQDSETAPWAQAHALGRRISARSEGTPSLTTYVLWTNKHDETYKLGWSVYLFACNIFVNFSRSPPLQSYHVGIKGSKGIQTSYPAHFTSTQQS